MEENSLSDHCREIQASGDIQAVNNALDTEVALTWKQGGELGFRSPGPYRVQSDCLCDT